jgi:hypothetical protein
MVDARLGVAWETPMDVQQTCLATLSCALASTLYAVIMTPVQIGNIVVMTGGVVMGVVKGNVPRGYDVIVSMCVAYFV